jgi:hypothetical protein
MYSLHYDKFILHFIIITFYKIIIITTSPIVIMLLKKINLMLLKKEKYLLMVGQPSIKGVLQHYKEQVKIVF